MYIINDGWQEENVNEYGEVIPRSSAINEEISEKSFYEKYHMECLIKRYWKVARLVVDAAGRIQAGSFELRKNFFSYPVVCRVADEYCEGKVSKLQASRSRAIDEFYKQTIVLGAIYKKISGLSPDVSESRLLNWLTGEKSQKMRDKFRYHIDKHITNLDDPFPLDEIPERDFKRGGNHCG